MNFSGAFGGLAAAVGQERDALRIGTTDSDGLLLTTVTTAGLPFPFASLPHFSFAPRMMFSNALTAQPGHMMMLNAPGIHQQLMASYANGGVPNNVDVLPPTHRPAHRTHVHHGYVGLPYQDHNYVAPLPCTPPHSPVLASAKTHQIQLDDVSYHTTVTTSNVKEVVVSSTGPPDIPPCDDSVTRCICDFQHDDGYMICCDSCGVWQHVDCMRVDRMNIPESYLCELCEPRAVDKHRAIQIQTKKRDDLSLLPMDSSATETEDETTQDDSSSLHNGRKKLRKDFDDMAVLGSKKRTKRIHKDDSPKKKWHLKMRNNGLSDNKLLLSPQKPILSRHQSFGGISNDGFTVPEEALNGSMPGSLAVTPTEALFAAVECVTAYQDASCNCYTPELQNLLASIRFNGQHTSGPHWPPVVGCAEIAAQLAQHQPCRVASVTGSKMGLEATDDIITHQPLVEYVGNVMLRDQYDCGVPSSESVQPYVLFYTKLDGLDLCVDARLYGNEARFVRRSCTPNAEVRHVLDGSTVRFFIHATKSIIRGAEITIPFDFNYHKCTSHVECACTRLSCPVAKYQKQRELNHLPSAAKRQRVTRSVDSRLPLTTMQEVNPLPPVTTPSKMPTVQNSVSMTTRNRKPPPLLHLNSEPLQTHSNMTPETTTPAIDIDVSAKSAPLPLMSPVKTPRSQQIPTSAPTSAGSSETETHPTPNCSHSDSDDGEKSKKKTREEKKLEAIVKAFERMEKREERKKEALARMEHARKKQNKEKDSVTIKTEADADLSLDSGSNWEQSLDIKQETPVPEKEKVKSENVPSKSKKSRQSSSSRRASINVSAPPQTISAAPTVGTAAAQPVVTATEQPTVETPNATVAVSSCDEEISSGLPSNMPPVVSDESVPPAVCPAVPTIHFPKKLMMRGHEARRMSAAADLNRPLTVQTDGPDVNDSSSGAEAEYMTCVPSPHTFSLSSLRRDSLTGKSLVGANAGDTRGSAKKRWLQKAMFESTKTVTVTLSDGITSVAGTDSMGGNTVCTAASLSPAGDFVTPLKKRRLARESLSIDGSITGIAEEDDSPSTHALSPCATPCSISSGVNRPLPGGSLGESSSDSRDDVWSQIVNRLRTTISSVPKLNGDECGPSVIGSMGVVFSEAPTALCSPHFQIGHVNGATNANLINSSSVQVAVCASDYLHNINHDNFRLEAVNQAMISCNSAISDRLPVPSNCGIASSCFPLEVSRTRNDSVGSVSEQSEQPVSNGRVRSYSGISLVSISSNSTGEESPRLDPGTQPVVSDDGSCLEFNREHNQDLEYAAHLSKFGIVGIRSLPVNGITVTTAGGWFLPGYHPANMGAYISAAAENSAPNTLTPLVSMSMSSNSNNIASLTADHRTSEGTWQTGLRVHQTWSQNPSTDAQFVHPFHQDPGTSAVALSQSSANWCSLNNTDSQWNPAAALSDSFAASRSPPYRLGIGQEYVLAASCVPGTSETSLAAGSVAVIGSPVWSANFDTTSNGSFTDVIAGYRPTSAMCSSTPLSAASSKKKVSLLEYRQRMSQRSTENLTLLNMSPSHSSPAVVPLTVQHMSSEVCMANDTSSEKGQPPESLCNGNYGQSSSVEGSSHSSELSLRHETVTDVCMPLSSGSDSSDVGSVTYASKSDCEVFLASASGSIICDTAVPRRRLVDMDDMRSDLDESRSLLRVEHEAKQDIGLSVSEQPASSYSL